MTLSTDPFTFSILVQPSDIDELNHVNNVVYVRWVQEVAVAHWNTMASEQLKNEVAWMLHRHEIDYKNQSFLGDTITGYTWVGEAKGATFERFVKLMRGDVELTFSRMVWVMLDAKTLKPKRIDAPMIELLRKSYPS
ncbi:MAG: acyl-CoA thioesterase [Chryseotalea sp. WA131a]|nr:MAG: acyl-CoA thioesterase [Chryseotalea sp. WA131a]